MRPSVPAQPPVATIAGGWQLYRLPQAELGSPLWVEFKLLNLTLPRKWGQLRTFTFCWGIDAGRLRRDKGAASLAAQQPIIYEAVLHFLAGAFTPAHVEAQIGSLALYAERERVAAAADRRAAERKAAKRPAVDPFS